MTPLLPRPLRWFWRAWFITIFGIAAIAAGPTLEADLFPLRDGQSIAEIGRSPATFRFVWVSYKRRSPAFVDIDVALYDYADRDHVRLKDRFVVTLFRDESRPGEPPCTRMVPWSRSGAVKVGHHYQHFCVETPSTVDPGDWLSLSVKARYEGLLGLWEVPVVFPLVEVPAL